MTMTREIALLASFMMLTGCMRSTELFEPGPAELSLGTSVLVDDGTCPEADIKRVTGGNGTTIPRKYECVPNPNSIHSPLYRG
jgi:hypothetical protein